MATRANLKREMDELQKEIDKKWQHFVQGWSLYFSSLSLLLSHAPPSTVKCKYLWVPLVIMVSVSTPFGYALRELTKRLEALTVEMKRRQKMLKTLVPRPIAQTTSWLKAIPLLPSLFSRWTSSQTLPPALIRDPLLPRQEEEADPVVTMDPFASRNLEEAVDEVEERSWWSYSSALALFYLLIFTLLTALVWVELGCLKEEKQKP